MPRYVTSKLLDSFGGTLANWSTFNTGAPLILSGGALKNDGVNGRCGSYYNANQFGPAVEAVVTVSAYAGADEIDVGVRCSTTSSTTFSGYAFTIATNGVAINKFTAGTPSSLASNTTFTVTPADIFSCAAVGSKLTLSRYASGAWTTVLETIDATFSTPGWASIQITNFGGGQQIGVDDFYAGTVNLPGPVGYLQAVKRAAGW